MTTTTQVPLANPYIARPGRLRDAAKLLGLSHDWVQRHWRELVDRGRIKHILPHARGAPLILDLADLDSYIRRCSQRGEPLLPDVGRTKG